MLSIRSLSRICIEEGPSLFALFDLHVPQKAQVRAPSNTIITSRDLVDLVGEERVWGQGRARR